MLLSSLSPSAASPRPMTSRSTSSRSAPVCTTKLTSQSPTSQRVRWVSAEVLSTELGMTCSVPSRARTMVWRQVTSVTTPEKPLIETSSPGSTTLPNMRPRPDMMFATVACRPREMMTEPTPRAATRPVGLIPKMGCMSESRATSHKMARTMLMKMDAEGMFELSSAFRMARTSTYWTSKVAMMTTATKTDLATKSGSSSPMTDMSENSPIRSSLR